MRIKNSFFKSAICLLIVLSLCPVFSIYLVKANATGCLASEVRLYDSGSGKHIQVEGIYANLKGELYENGKLIKEVSTLSASYAKNYYARFILGVDYAESSSLKLGNQYRFKLILPEGYVLDRINITGIRGSLPKGYKLSGDSVIFTYDEEIQKQVRRGGIGGGFDADYYIRNAMEQPNKTPVDTPKAKQSQTLTAKYRSGTNKQVGASFRQTVKGAKTKVTFASSNPKVAKVNKNGKITCVSVGKTVITTTAQASSGYKKATSKFTLTVTPKKVRGVHLKFKKKGQAIVEINTKIAGNSGYQILYRNRGITKTVNIATSKKSATKDA